MSRMSPFFYFSVVSGLGAASVHSATILGTPHLETLHLGLVASGGQQVDSLGPLASAAALEPSLVFAPQHVAGLIAHPSIGEQAQQESQPNLKGVVGKKATIKEGSTHVGSSHLGFIATGGKQTDTLGPLASAAGLEPAFVLAPQHVAGLISHASIAKQVPIESQPNWKGAVDKKATIKEGTTHVGSSHLGLLARGGKHGESLGPLASAAALEPSLVLAPQHVAGLIAHLSNVATIKEEAAHVGTSHLRLIATGGKQADSLGPLASAAALEPALVLAPQHVAGLIAHPSIADQAPKQRHLNRKGAINDKSTIKEEAAHVGTSHLGLIATGGKHGGPLGPLASAAALEPSFVLAPQHVAGLIAHLNIVATIKEEAAHVGTSHLGLIATGGKQADSLGPLASAAGLEPAFALAPQHVAGLISHARIAEKGAEGAVDTKATIKEEAPRVGSSHLGLLATGGQQTQSLGPLASAAALEPALVLAPQHVAGLIAHASVAEQAPKDPHPNWKGAPIDKKATVKVGANGAGFVGSGRAPKLERAPVGVSPPQVSPPELPSPPQPPTIEEVKAAVPERPEVPGVPSGRWVASWFPDWISSWFPERPEVPGPPKSVVPEEWGQRKCFYLMLLMLCFCGCFGVVAQQEHGLHVGGAVAVTPPFFLLGYMCTQTDVMLRFWHGEQVGWWCAVLCFWASLQLIFGVSVLVAVGASTAMAKKQQAAEAQGASEA